MYTMTVGSPTGKDQVTVDITYPVEISMAKMTKVQ